VLVGAFQLSRFVVPALDAGEEAGVAVGAVLVVVPVVMRHPEASGEGEGRSGLEGGEVAGEAGEILPPSAEVAANLENGEEGEAGEAGWTGQKMGAFLRHLTAGEIDAARELLEAGVGRIEPGLLLAMGESLARVRIEKEVAGQLRGGRDGVQVEPGGIGLGEVALVDGREEEAEEVIEEPAVAPGGVPETLAVPFALNGAVLWCEGREVVGRAALPLGEDGGLDVEIHGMADWLGDPSYNSVLAQARATAVEDISSASWRPCLEEDGLETLERLGEGGQWEENWLVVWPW
jgi:hypothetical protein